MSRSKSGPAAGVIASVELGRRIGRPNLISFDMGGTTAKACLIRDGVPSMVSMLEVGGEASGFFGVRITGLPIKAPSIDLVECSAGGGSIAWFDVSNVLKVGPESAGAAPGPACYNKGGTRPTVTDAHVALGHIGADALLGGEMRIDPDKAQRAIQEHVAGPLNLSLEEAAQGIIDVVNATMVRILRVVSVSRGFDPRRFALVAYGGAGPLHAGDIADELGISQVIIPPMPGLFSAMGLLASDIEVVVGATHVVRMVSENIAGIEQWLTDLEGRCRNLLDQEGVAPSQQQLHRMLELRYVRQNFDLPVPVGERLDKPEQLQQVLAEFHQAHHRNYGHSNASDPVEVVNFRIRGVGRLAPTEDAGAAGRVLRCERSAHRASPRVFQAERLDPITDLRSSQFAREQHDRRAGGNQRIRLHRSRFSRPLRCREHVRRSRRDHERTSHHKEFHASRQGSYRPSSGCRILAGCGDKGCSHLAWMSAARSPMSCCSMRRAGALPPPGTLHSQQSG